MGRTYSVLDRMSDEWSRMYAGSDDLSRGEGGGEGEARAAGREKEAAEAVAVADRYEMMATMEASALRSVSSDSVA
jgi:hypothetical protein